jgi:hypothetical protein
MRSFDYARTLPEAREGLPVFVLDFAVVIMAREPLWAVWIGVNGFRTGLAIRRKWRICFNEVETNLRVTQ